jgi:hypothetical protein
MNLLVNSLLVINYEFVSEFSVDDIFDLSKVLELVEGKTNNNN